MPRSRVEESVVEIENMIIEGVYKDPIITVRTKAFAHRVRDHWRNLAHEEFDDETGEYVNSVVVKRRPERAFKKLPQFDVGTRFWRAHFIEYGTGVDTKGASPRHLTSVQRRGREPLTVTRDTPTEEFAFSAKTAHYFGGTPDNAMSEMANTDA